MSRNSELIRLGDLCETISGLWTGKKPPFEKATVIRNTNFTKDCKLDLSNVAVLDVETKQLQTRRLIPGDLILEKSGGGPKQAVGRVVYFNETEGTYSLSNFTSALRLKDSSKALPMYLRDFLYFQYISGVTENMQSHSTGIRNLNIHQFLDIKIPLPSMDKQLEIVENLDRTFAEIDLLDAQQRESAKYVGNMLESYIDNLLLSDQHENVPLTNLATLENGDRGSSYPNKNMRERTGIPFINAGHIGEGKLDMSQMDYISRDTFDKLSRGKIQRNDLLFCLRGSLGKTALLTDLNEGAIASSLVIVRAKDTVDPKFLLYYFLSSICKSEIEEFRSGTAQPNLGGADLKKFSVPKHSPRRMQEIVTKIDEMASQVENLTKNNTLRTIALGELRQSLLHHAFNQEESVA